MEDVAKIADRVLVMNKGKVAMFGTVDEIFSKAEDLRSMGLAIPQVTRIFIKLKHMGYDVNSAIYDTNTGTNEILKLLKRI